MCELSALEILGKEPDVCYSSRGLMTWAQVKKAMARVKPFEKIGMYLIIDQTFVGDPNSRYKSLRADQYRVRVMGPKKISDPLIFSKSKSLFRIK